MSSEVSSASQRVEPRWLDVDEQKAWRAWLYSSQLLADRLNSELLTDTGISHAYYEILVQLSETPGHSLRMSELAERCLSSRSRLSHAVARLEEAGWVTRRECPTDKRGSFAVLTDEGFAALEAAAPGHVTEVREKLFDKLTPEKVEQLGAISEAILSGVDGPELPSCPDLTGDR